MSSSQLSSWWDFNISSYLVPLSVTLSSSLVLQSFASIGSSSCHNSITSISNGDNFRISTFQNSEIPTSSIELSTGSLHHKFGLSHFHPMEADCQESSSATMA